MKHYCIGGALDGQVAESDGMYLEHRVPLDNPRILLPPSDYWIQPPRYRTDIYERRGFLNNGHLVYFWVINMLSDFEAADRALELYLEAAILQDESLINT